MKPILPFVLLGLALGLGACSGYPPPEAAMSNATAASRAATEFGADREGDSQAHLKRANDLIAEATAAKTDGKNRRADLLFQQGQAEAELALMLAKEKTARDGAADAQEKLKSLKAGN